MGDVLVTETPRILRTFRDGQLRKIVEIKRMNRQRLETDLIRVVVERGLVDILQPEELERLSTGETLG